MIKPISIFHWHYYIPNGRSFVTTFQNGNPCLYNYDHSHEIRGYEALGIFLCLFLSCRTRRAYMIRNHTDIQPTHKGPKGLNSL